MISATSHWPTLLLSQGNQHKSVCLKKKKKVLFCWVLSKWNTAGSGFCLFFSAKALELHKKTGVIHTYREKLPIFLFLSWYWTHALEQARQAPCHGTVPLAFYFLTIKMHYNVKSIDTFAFYHPQLYKLSYTAKRYQEGMILSIFVTWFVRL